jgi:hypothetical protein
MRDFYLRQQMDVEGWVPIAHIATFKRLSMLTLNVEDIVASLGASVDVSFHRTALLCYSRVPNRQVDVCVSQKPNHCGREYFPLLIVPSILMGESDTSSLSDVFRRLYDSCLKVADILFPISASSHLLLLRHPARSFGWCVCSTTCRLAQVRARDASRSRCSWPAAVTLELKRIILFQRDGKSIRTRSIKFSLATVCSPTRSAR